MREFQPVRLGDRSAHQIGKKAVTKEDEIVSNFTYPRGHSARKAPAASGIYIPMRYVEEKLGKSSRYSSNELIGEPGMGEGDKGAPRKNLWTVSYAAMITIIGYEISDLMGEISPQSQQRDTEKIPIQSSRMKSFHDISKAIIQNMR